MPLNFATELFHVESPRNSRQLKSWQAFVLVRASIFITWCNLVLQLTYNLCLIPTSLAQCLLCERERSLHYFVKYIFMQKYRGNGLCVGESPACFLRSSRLLSTWMKASLAVTFWQLKPHFCTTFQWVTETVSDWFMACSKVGGVETSYNRVSAQNCLGVFAQRLKTVLRKAPKLNTPHKTVRIR